MVEVFSAEVCKQLEYYVYRLIDPRSGQTFYVGKGVGNRVFSHVSEARKGLAHNSERVLTEKIGKIQEIHDAGLEVIHVIHRYGMNEETAFEVEAALIEAYPGLTNDQEGHASNERGCSHAQEIISRFQLKMIEPRHNLLAINISRSRTEGRDYYDAVRMFWRISEARAKSADYVLAHKSGAVVDVFIADEWIDSADERFSKYLEPDFVFDPPRKGFIGRQAPGEILDLYRNTRLPAVKKGAASPIRYLSPQGEFDQ